MKRVLLIMIIIALSTNLMVAQDFLSQQRISGNFQFDGQLYQQDSIIGAQDVDEKFLSNGYLYLNYSLGNFTAGMRYESYMNPMLGFDPRYEGQGLAYRFLEFNSDLIDVTAGNFYEQFGSGMILRAYEDRQLGYDNAIDGMRIRFRPTEGIELKGVIGKQREFWNQGEGIVRGGDISIGVTDIFTDIFSETTNLSIGASVVSKFQEDLSAMYILPENVLAWATRMSLIGDGYSVDAEYVFKNNDPSATNGMSYNIGEAFLLNSSIFGKGYSFSLNFHRDDNMDFRSDRNSQGNVLQINYLPPLTKQHAYRLTTIYPYSTQPLGEVGLQADFIYTFPRKSLIGGKYGTTVSMNYSRVHNLDTTHIDEFTYESPFFSIGERLYFQDINIEVIKKWNRDLKTVFALVNIVYDKDILENEGVPHYGKIYSTAAIADVTYSITNTNSIRLELQHLWATQDSTLHVPDNISGNWVMALLEYTIAPKWYFTIMDEYNYGNDFEDRQLHYFSAGVTYVHQSTRIALGYGRQRGGILCVGGVCREVPSSNGVTISLSSSF
jgi:hypothetical protein